VSRLSLADRLGVAPRLMALGILAIATSTQPIFIAAAAIGSMGDELGYGPGRLGVLTAAYFITAGFFSAPLGALVERLGWQRALRINAVGAGIVLITMSLAVRNIPTLVILLMTGAIVYGLANPAANVALARHGSATRQGVLFGMKHAGIPSSTLIAGVAIPAIVTPLGWRWAYVFAALLAVVVFLLVPRTEPQSHAEAEHPDDIEQEDLLDKRSLIITALGAFLASSAPAALAAFTVAAALDVGMSDDGGGWLLAAGSLVSISARLLNGIGIDRWPGNSYMRMSGLLLIGGGVMLGIAFDVSVPVFAFLVVVAFATAWSWPGLMTYTIVTRNPNRPAAATGITQAGVFLGSGSMPIVIGALVEARGFPAGWTVAALTVASGGVLMWVLARRIPVPTRR
jgi:MFS family permease